MFSIPGDLSDTATSTLASTVVLSSVTPNCLYYDSFLCSHIISCPIFTCIHGYNFRQVTLCLHKKQLIRSTRLPLVVLDSWTPPWQLPEGNGWLNTALKMDYFRLLCAGIAWRNATVFGHSENWTQRKVEIATPDSGSIQMTRIPGQFKWPGFRVNSNDPDSGSMQMTGFRVNANDPDSGSKHFDQESWS